LTLCDFKQMVSPYGGGLESIGMKAYTGTFQHRGSNPLTSTIESYRWVKPKY